MSSWIYLRAETFGANLNDDIMIVEQWDTILFKLNDSKRFRQTVGSIAVSCLTSATPLLASMSQAACLVALDIVEVFFLNLLF